MQLRSFPVIDRRVMTVPEITVTTRRAAPPAWKNVIQVLRPHRWALPMVAMLCGALISGGAEALQNQWAALTLGLLLVGPLLTGAGSAINAYFDRDVTAHHAYELLRSARINLDAIVATIGVLSLVSLLVAHQFGSFAFNVTSLTLAIHFALNAPPLRLRRHTWWNALFFGLISVGGPWILGETFVGPISANSLVLASIFGFGALGLHLVDTLPRGEGERRAGLRTLAAILGPEVGAGISALVIDTCLLGAAIVCFGGQALSAAGAILVVLAVLLSLQLASFKRPALKPRVVYGFSLLLFMAAMLISATSLCHHVIEL